MPVMVITNFRQQAFKISAENLTYSHTLPGSVGFDFARDFQTVKAWRAGAIVSWWCVKVDNR